MPTWTTLPLGGRQRQAVAGHGLQWRHGELSSSPGSRLCTAEAVMVRATALGVGLCPRMVRGDWCLRCLRGAARRPCCWRCIRAHLPHLGRLSRPVRLHVPAPSTEHHHLCGPRISPDNRGYRVRGPHRAHRYIPHGSRSGARLLEGRRCDGELVPEGRSRRSPRSESGYVIWLFLMVGLILLLRASGRGRTGWEPTALIIVACLPPVWMCIEMYAHPQDVVALGFALAAMACALRDRWIGSRHPDRTRDSHAAVHAARRHTALRRGSRCSEIARLPSERWPRRYWCRFPSWR